MRPDMTTIQRVNNAEKGKQVVGIIGLQGVTKVDVKKTMPTPLVEDELSWRTTLRRRHYTLRRKSQAPPLKTIKESESYSPKAEKEVVEWITKLTGDTLTPGNLGVELKDGVVLNNIAHAIKPAECPNIKPSKVPYKQMANIATFRKFCLSIGLKDYELFHVTDLYEGNDIGNFAYSCSSNYLVHLGAVIRTLITLGKKVKTLVSEYNGPQIQWTGPVTYY